MKEDGFTIGVVVGGVIVFLIFVLIGVFSGCTGGINPAGPPCIDNLEQVENDCGCPEKTDPFQCPPKKRCIFDPQTGKWKVEEPK